MMTEKQLQDSLQEVIEKRLRVDVSYMPSQSASLHFLGVAFLLVGLRIAKALEDRNTQTVKP